MTSLSVQTGDIGTFANISGSGIAQFGGATILGSTLGLTGAADFESTLEVQSGVYNHGYRRYEMSTITANTELTASSSKSYQMVSGGTSALTVILPSASAGQYYQYGIKRHSLMSGNVVIDAANYELPIITTNCKSGPSEIIDNGKGGFLVPLKSPIALSEQIKFVINNNKVAKSKSLYAKKRINRFLCEKNSHIYLNFLENKLNDR